MGWKGIVYGDIDQVRPAVLAWAERFHYPERIISFEEMELLTSDNDEGAPGVAIAIAQRVNPPQIKALLSRLERDAGGRAYAWRMN
jgi:hypothetical protein